jgi:hypothetical protein
VIPSLFEKFGERMTVDTLLVDELARRAILGERENKRLEALLRAKDETIGELLEMSAHWGGCCDGQTTFPCRFCGRSAA